MEVQTSMMTFQTFVMAFQTSLMTFQTSITKVQTFVTLMSPATILISIKGVINSALPIRPSKIIGLIIFIMVVKRIRDFLILLLNNRTIIKNNLPAGMYFYKFIDENKEVLGIGKMVAE
jgi:hypothetical protein